MPLTSAVAGDYPAVYSALYTTTVQNYRKTLVDVISDSIPLWWWLNQKGRKKYQTGGESILQPLMYKLNTVQAFDGLDKLDTTTKEGIVPAVFLWKYYHTSIVIPKKHLKMNTGEAAVLSLLEAELEQSAISFRDQLNQDCCNNTSNNKKIDSLETIISDENTATIYGGIADTTYTWWQPQGGTTRGNISSLFGANGVDRMRQTYYDCTRGNDKPDLLLCTQNFYENYDRTQIDQKRYTNTNAADAGFENLAYHGMTIMFDRDVGANLAFMINSNYINLVVDPTVEFEPTGFMDAYDQWAIFNRNFWMGNLTCSNRSRQGLLINGDTYS